MMRIGNFCGAGWTGIGLAEYRDNASSLLEYTHITEEYAAEHDHVKGKQTDIQNLTFSVDTSHINHSRPDNIEDLAEALSKTYKIYNDRGVRVGCEPTPEGIMTYMNAVQSLYVRDPEAFRQNSLMT